MVLSVVQTFLSALSPKVGAQRQALLLTHSLWKAKVPKSPHSPKAPTAQTSRAVDL